MPYVGSHASPDSPLEITTLKHAVVLLRERLAAVKTYGAGGCPTLP